MSLYDDGQPGWLRPGLGLFGDADGRRRRDACEGVHVGATDRLIDARENVVGVEV